MGETTETSKILNAPVDTRFTNGTPILKQLPIRIQATIYVLPIMQLILLPEPILLQLCYGRKSMLLRIIKLVPAIRKQRKLPRFSMLHWIQSIPMEQQQQLEQQLPKLNDVEQQPIRKPMELLWML